jgi:predicted RNase H-like HicB family nuclease
MGELATLLRQPWTVEVRREDAAIVLTVEELPGFFAAGLTPDEAETNFWEALSSHLSSFIDLDEEPPRPRFSSKSVVTEVGSEPGRQSVAESSPRPVFEHLAA